MVCMYLQGLNGKNWAIKRRAKFCYKSQPGKMEKMKNTANIL